MGKHLAMETLGAANDTQVLVRWNKGRKSRPAWRKGIVLVKAAERPGL